MNPHPFVLFLDYSAVLSVCQQRKDSRNGHERRNKAAARSNEILALRSAQRARAAEQNGKGRTVFKNYFAGIDKCTSLFYT